MHRRTTGMQPGPTPPLPAPVQAAPRAPEPPVDDAPVHTEYDEYGGDELDEYGMFAEGDDVFDNLDPDAVIGSK